MPPVCRTKALRYDETIGGRLLRLKNVAAARNRPIKQKKPLRQNAPKALERQYQKTLRRIISQVAAVIRIHVIPRLPDLVAEAQLESGIVDHERFDLSVAQKISGLFAATRAGVDSIVAPRKIENLALDIGTDVDAYNKNQVGKVFKSVLGVAPFAQEPFLEAQMSAFVHENAKLITNVTMDFVNQTEQIVFRGVRRGLRHEEIAKSILGTVKDKEGFRGRFRVAKTRANLIGRDQVNKFYGTLNKSRQTNLGLKKYKWTTARDERVRDDHAQREGHVFSWNSPPSDGHPGEPINCRCIAEPIFDELLK